MSLRRLFFHSMAVLLVLLVVYVWLGVAWINGILQPWIYQVLT